MKIAAVHSRLDQLRGAERAFLNMILYLKDRGHEIDLYTIKASEYFLKKFKEKNIGVYDLQKEKNKNPILSLINLYSFHLYYLIKLSREINKRNYDLIFVHHFLTSPIIPFLKYPCVYYCQEPVRMVYEVNLARVKLAHLPYSYIDKFSVKKADLVLANSDYTREYIYRVYGIFSITNYLGVDTNLFRKIEIEKENFILSIGVLHPVKAHDFVIRALGTIPKQKRPKLVLVGNGPEKNKNYLRTLASKCDVTLEIKENIDDIELVYLYNKAKVTTAAHMMEPFGLTAIESMACETPVVAVREGGFRESVVDGVTGLLTERDEKEFAEAIKYLLENPEVTEIMGRKGRERVEKYFTWEKCVENLEKNLRKIIGKS
ncbi:MAG: glycosyltransferase family 4 protein [Candidatus Aenigmarchaeota archaeon]|nr:glycosyltransferase family 4 protein [Candidatus Aenigmarchaeota archaeon]MDW8160393.1 glycosyltransferase family 4 protein [Candidatus Aenigmarchaeota archaeon]